MNPKHVFIKSGELYFAKNGETVSTTLGTCVAFCVYDQHLQIAGLVHYLLPSQKYGRSDNQANLLNFGDVAIFKLLKIFKDHGSKKTDLQISIFGGCLSGKSLNSNAQLIAKENIAIARQIIKKFDLKIHFEKTCVSGGMTIKIDAKTGELFIKKSKSGNNKSNPSVTNETRDTQDSHAPGALPILSPTTNKNVQVINQSRVKKKLKVLIVDDSSPIRKVLSKILEKYQDIEVVAAAESAMQAEILRKKHKPDVITLDIHMPEIDGITYLAQLMKNNPLPVIMISDLSIKEASPVMKALELGAFDYIKKPSLSELEEISEKLYHLIIAASQAKRENKNNQKNEAPNKKSSKLNLPRNTKMPDLICIGASTGGTEALKKVFHKFPSQTPPILVVQHMPSIFTAAFADSLNRISQIKVKEASNGEILCQNCAYIAPGGQQMKVKINQQGQTQIILTDDPPVNRFKPSVDYLFKSISENLPCEKITSALLTGMGDDGARGLLSLKKKGAKTIAQNEESCVVYGMPKAAADLNAATFILDIEDIAYALIDIKKQDAKAS